MPADGWADTLERDLWFDANCPHGCALYVMALEVAISMAEGKS